jgi:hypothetical protein
MNFQDLHELLRLELSRRIEQGALTGTRLAQQTGFRQAHMSNFLNRRRALSLEGLDRVLAAQGLGIDEILPVRIAASADAVPETEGAGRQDATEIVPVVTLSAAGEEAQIQPAHVIETEHVSASRVAGNRARVSPRQAGWQRFVAVRPNAQEIAAMQPVLAAGTIAVIDRHYNSIAPYRADQPTLLAIRFGSSLLLRLVELDGGRLILRPCAMEHPLHFVTMGANETPSDYVVGRVCLLLQEL